MALPAFLVFVVLAEGCGGGGGSGGGGEVPNTMPTAVAVANPEVGAVPLDVALDGSGSSDADGNVSAYRWSFGDGSAEAAGATVDHTFAQPGTYQVQLTVTDNDGASASTSVDVTVIEGEPPQAVAAASPETGTAPLTVDFTSAGSSDADGIIVLYEWDFGDGSNPARGQTVSHQYQAAGDYDVALRVVDDDGLFATASVLVQVDPAGNLLPQAQFSTTPDTGTAPLAAQFDASASSDPDGQIVDYQWDFDDGSAPQSGAMVTHSFAANGIYQVQLTVTDNVGGSATTTGTVTVGTAPVANIAASPDTGTPPLAVSFDGTGSSDGDGSVVSYAWDFDDGDTATGPTPGHTFQDPGEYEVTLTVTDNHGLPSALETYVVSVTQDPTSLSFRDFFNTDSVGQYDVVAGAGQSVSYDNPNDRMRVVTDLGSVEVARNIPAENEAFYRIRFLPTDARTSAASFTLRLEEDDTTYYEIFGVESVDGGEESGGIRKVVNGTVVANGEAFYPIKPFFGGGPPGGYLDDLAYSVNVYFSPSRLTAEFTELRPRVLSITPAGGSPPIKVGRMRVLLQDQDAYLDDIVKEPIGNATLQYYVAFGDSITEGVGDNLSSDGHGYPIVMQEAFQDRLETSHVVFNEGFEGIRSDEALDEIDALVARHPRAQYYTIQLGTNDALQGTATKAQFKANLQTILNTITGAGKTPYLARMPHARLSAPTGPAINGRIEAYNEAVDELVDENDLIVVPPDFECFFDANPSLMGADEIHPTGDGYRAMAELWYKMIDLGLSATMADACTLP